jgi:hypothetical protein
VTEQEWLLCKELVPILEFLRERASERKLRLFACACCHRVRHLLSDKRSRRALSIAERYADGEVSEEKVGYAWGDARRAAQLMDRQERETGEASAMYAVSMLCDANIYRAVAAVRLATLSEAYSRWCPVPIARSRISLEKASCRERVCKQFSQRFSGVQSERDTTYSREQARLADIHREQILLLRDIFSPPQPVTIEPTLRTPAAVQLARSLYEERRFEDMPVLADALEEAGCQDAAVLGHCRSGGDHVRGCWLRFVDCQYPDKMAG